MQAGHSRQWVVVWNVAGRMERSNPYHLGIRHPGWLHREKRENRINDEVQPDPAQEERSDALGPLPRDKETNQPGHDEPGTVDSPHRP